MARSQRSTRATSGSPRAPMSTATSARVIASRSLSSWARMPGSSAPPRNTRTSTHPSGARPGNLELEKLTARARRPAERGTTIPAASSGWATAPRANPSETIADPAMSMPRSSPATSGAIGASRPAATSGGTASTTASAAIRSGIGAAPSTVTLQRPVAVAGASSPDGPSPRTTDSRAVARPVTNRTPLRSSRSRRRSGSVPSPPASERNCP